MAWQNAFTIGACTLAVHKNGSATAMTACEMTTDGVTVSVSEAGLVTMVQPTTTNSYEARVTPSYVITGADVRLSAMTVSVTPGVAAGKWDGATAPAELVYSAGALTPTPLTFALDEPWSRVGLLVQIVGGG